MKLTYYNFCPFSRALRIALIEKDIPFSLDILNPWESHEKEVLISPAGNIPSVYDEIDEHKFRVLSATACYEYLEDGYHDSSLYGDDLLIRAEIRRIITWMDNEFFTNVSLKFIKEKILTRVNSNHQPNSQALIKAFDYLPYYMDYINFLASKRNWIAGKEFSMADIVVGSHLSIIDYLGDINWSSYPNAKEWYVKLKSRPSFREMLEDKIGNIFPSANYKELDF